MAERNHNISEFDSILVRPVVGTTLTILSGLAFLLLAMFLPLVGKSAVKTEQYALNFTVYLCLLIITLALSGLAVKSKLDRRKIDGSPYPLFSMIIGGLSFLLFISLILGLLKI